MGSILNPELLQIKVPRARKSLKSLFYHRRITLNTKITSDGGGERKHPDNMWGKKPQDIKE